MAVAVGPFNERVRSASSVGIDTTVLIYHLEDIVPYSALTQELFATIAKNNKSCIISTLCLTELLTGPLRDNNPSSAELAERFVMDIPNLNLVPVDKEVARYAAFLRAKHSLKTPDALMLATAHLSGCSLFVANDRALRKASTEKTEVILLDDYA